MVSVSFSMGRVVKRAVLCAAIVSTVFLLREVPNASWKEWGFDVGYTAASYLSDPLLAAHRWRWQIPILHELYPEASPEELWLRRTMYGAAIGGAGVCSCVTTPFGVLTRTVLIGVQKDPFLACKGMVPEKSFTEQFSLLSWNLCCVPGGYSITDGGVLPWSFRIQNLPQAILEQNADVVCLYEIFDIQTAHRLIEGLKENYSSFFYCIGPRAIGPSSGIFVASKFKTEDPHFHLYPQDALDGRGQYSNKGFFSFTLTGDAEQKVRIYTTHMGHSEVPALPTPSEVAARKKAQSLILQDMQTHLDKVQILTGDLNLDYREWDLQEWGTHFDRGSVVTQATTWDGDDYGATRIVHKPPSQPSILDYTLIYRKGAQAALSTHYIETGFNPTEFRLHAISDHKGIFSQINLKRSQ